LRPGPRARSHYGCLARSAARTIAEECIRTLRSDNQAPVFTTTQRADQSRSSFFGAFPFRTASKPNGNFEVTTSTLIDRAKLPEVGGVLVGGASLNAADFEAIFSAVPGHA